LRQFEAQSRQEGSIDSTTCHCHYFAMDTAPDDLDLAQLAAAAGVTPRTVRYYVQQGLLPSPGTRGPGTRYDRSLLDRLQLIKLLQRQHLPLSEIRRRLESLDDEGVRAALRSLPDMPAGDSALGYVRRALGRVAEEGTEFSMLRLRTPDLLSRRTPAAHPTRATWERVTLAPDVELHIRRPLSREQNKLVDRLLDAARAIFSEEP
jgi:DNA-binding transcriptional MerR regulator